jgi:peptidoglycan/LPS O-acetylase OafA/YrhL
LPFGHFGRFGDFSYGTYLYAFPIQQTIAWRFPDIHPVRIFFLALPATVAVAVLSWHLIEKPFLHRRSRATAPDADTSGATVKPLVGAP